MNVLFFSAGSREPLVLPAKTRRLLLFVAALGGLALVGWAARRLWDGDRGDPDRLWEEAQAAWQSGKLERADRALARLEGRRPPTLAERLLRAEVARARGRIGQALAALDGFSDADPGAAVLWRTRGMLELERDRARPAESALLRAVALDGKLAEARRDLIKLYTIQSRRHELSSQFRAMEAIGPLTFDELCLWCLGRRLDVGEAELAAKLEKMLENDPADRLIRLPLAENLRRLGRLADAEAVLTPISAADPAARASRAAIALDRGAVDVATSLLAEGPPQDPALARLRGRLALARGDSVAVDHYRAALQADPDDRDTLFGLGQALRLAGQAGAAAPYLQAARDHDQLERLIQNARALSRRDIPHVLRDLGDACRAVHRLPEARAWYRLALVRNPADAELQKRLAELDGAIRHDAAPKNQRNPAN
jgi:predicted Zn-dependent protease